jgi:glycosyltransferase involved in cell wall biosynthesis
MSKHIKSKRPPSGFLKIAIISGGSLPGVCGIDDYTTRLVQALSDNNYLVFNYKPAALIGWISTINNSLNADVVHIQYPTITWRTSIMPIIAALSLKLLNKKLVITFHEFSRVHYLRKLISAVLLQLSDHSLVTNETELLVMSKINLFNRKLSIVPIGSNIEPIKKINSIKNGIIYFGLLAPNKGLEKFLEITKYFLFTNQTVSVIGSPVHGSERWLEKILSSNREVVFKLGLSDHEVSTELEKALIALLPYPDGISDRRGTALAALAHNLQLVTTAGLSTRPEHREICHLFKNSEEARDIILSIINDNAELIPIVFMNRYISKRSWPYIAQLHINIYQKLNLRN